MGTPADLSEEATVEKEVVLVVRMAVSVMAGATRETAMESLGPR